MDVTPLIKQGQQIIQSYAGGRFKVSGEIYEGALIVTPAGTQAWDSAPQDFDALTEAHFAPLIEIAHDVDVVLLGCGPKVHFLPQTLKESFKNSGLSVDIMDTGAACRTYNVLMAEGRRVAAALFPF